MIPLSVMFILVRYIIDIDYNYRGRSRWSEFPKVCEKILDLDYFSNVCMKKSIIFKKNLFEISIIKYGISKFLVVPGENRGSKINSCLNKFPHLAL